MVKIFCLLPRRFSKCYNSTMRKKRILIFSLMYYPLVGGAEIAVKETTDRVAGETLAFDMITLRYDRALPRVETIGNVTVYRVGFSKKGPGLEDLVAFPLYLIKVFYPLLAFTKALFLHRRNHYDALWAIMSYAGFPAVFMKMFYPRLSFILTLQEGDSIAHMTKRLRIRLVSPLYRLVFRRADRIQAISHFLAGFARDEGALCPTMVIPNGVSLEAFSQTYREEELLELGTSLGATAQTRYIITTSRLVPKNAVDILIMALKYIPPTVELIVVGDGPDRDMLIGLSKSEGVERRVHFTGQKKLDEIPKYLAIAEVFARLSRSEGLGTSFLEAMAAGLPVVATSVGGIVDFLVDGETGVVAKVNDPKDAAEKISRLLDNPLLLQKIAEKGRIMVEERFTWEKVARAMRSEVFDAV